MRIQIEVVNPHEFPLRKDGLPVHEGEKIWVTIPEGFGIPFDFGQRYDQNGSGAWNLFFNTGFKEPEAILEEAPQPPEQINADQSPMQKLIGDNAKSVSFQIQYKD